MSVHSDSFHCGNGAIRVDGTACVDSTNWRWWRWRALGLDAGAGARRAV